MYPLAGCGGNSVGPSPQPQPPVVTSITPVAGATTGGTVVTIAGSNFVAGAAATIAGVVATNVTVLNASSMTAVTGPRAAGSGDVVVTAPGGSGVLPSSFTYANPGPANNPAPVIASVSARGSRKNQPPEFADLGEDVAVTASVTDGETQPDQLIYQWTASSGTFSGSGPAVTWRAPAQATTPTTSSLTLAVVERYVTPDGVVHENLVERSVTVGMHDSAREVGDLAVLFLTEFSISSIAPDMVIRNFSTRCRGRALELSDVQDNRKDYIINAYTIGQPVVTIGFGGVCSFRSRAADACARVPTRWEVTELASGKPNVAEGVEQVTAIYDQDRWYLCDSDWDPSSTTVLRRFKK